MMSRVESRVVRGGGALDLVVCALFVLPPVAATFLRILFAVNGRLGGTAVVPPFEPLHWLFVGLTGALGVAWATARLLAPLRTLGRVDAFARLWVTALILYLVFAAGAPPVLLAFVATELGGALHQLWALRSSAREARW
jgi:hypothetical protein